MKLENKKHIIFDFDGTLIDSALDLSAAVNHMLTTLGKDGFSNDEIHHWIGNGASTLVKRALVGDKDISSFEDEELLKKALTIFLDYYKENCANETYLYDGVKNSLHHLKDLGYTLSIVTNKPYAFIAPILKNLDIDSLFSFYSSGDRLYVKKPDPYPLIYVCEKLNFSIEQSVMVGDSKNDIVAASEANMSSIAVNYGYNYGEDIAIYKPDYIIDSFCQIEKILEKR